MISSTTSLKTILDKIYRDLCVTTGTEWQDLIEWAGEALELLPSDQMVNMVTEPYKITIKKYRGRLPTNFALISDAEYNGFPLRLKSGIKPSTAFYNAGAASALPRPYKIYDWYFIPNKNYISTSFKEGTVYINYFAYNLDEDGLPLLPDHISVKEALTAYVDTKIGHRQWRNKEISLNDYDYLVEIWDSTYANAKAHIIFPDIDKMEAMKNAWMRFRPNINQWQTFFEGLTLPEYGNNFTSRFGR